MNKDQYVVESAEEFRRIVRSVILKSPSFWFMVIAAFVLGLAIGGIL